MTLRRRFNPYGKSALTNTLLILNVAAILFYFLVAIGTGQLSEVEEVMYSTPDSWGYRDVADWLLGQAEKPPDAASYRPFLYPLLLGMIRHFTHSAYAIWFVQFVFWLLAINLTSLSVFAFTKRVWLLAGSFLLFVLNVSAITETYHALTEIATLFLLAVWVYFYAYDQQSLSRSNRIVALVFLMSLLVVVKPVFQLHLILLMTLAIGSLIRRPRSAPLLLLALLPIFAQLALMVNLTGEGRISTISELTLRKYYFSQVYGLVEETSLEDARSIVDAQEEAENAKLLLKNPGSSLLLYISNVTFQNMLQGSDLLGEHQVLRGFTRVTNAVYYGLHLVALPLAGYVVARKKGKVLKIAILYLFSALIIASSGISFWQGDRLVVFALPMWLVAYSGILNRFLLEREERPK